MAITARVQHCFQGYGGTSRDMYCNQWYFWHASETAATAETWGPTVAGFAHELFVLGPAGGQVARFMAPRCLGNGGNTKIYDATASLGVIPEGPPIFVINDGALMGTGDYLLDLSGYIDTAQNLPEEVALCLSYQAAHTDGNLPRRRGRIYIGPLNTLALNDTTADSVAPTSPASSFMDALLNAAQVMQQNALAAGWHWRVFSKMDGLAFDIINFSVDSAFDTIRGRGPAASYRTTVPVL